MIFSKQVFLKNCHLRVVVRCVSEVLIYLDSKKTVVAVFNFKVMIGSKV